MTITPDCDVTTQRTPNTNDHHTPLNEPPPRKISAYATGWPHQMFTRAALRPRSAGSTRWAPGAYRG